MPLIQGLDPQSRSKQSKKLKRYVPKPKKRRAPRPRKLDRVRDVYVPPSSPINIPKPQVDKPVVEERKHVVVPESTMPLEKLAQVEDVFVPVAGDILDISSAPEAWAEENYEHWLASATREERHEYETPGYHDPLPTLKEYSNLPDWLTEAPGFPGLVDTLDTLKDGFGAWTYGASKLGYGADMFWAEVRGGMQGEDVSDIKEKFPTHDEWLEEQGDLWRFQPENLPWAENIAEEQRLAEYEARTLNPPITEAVSYEKLLAMFPREMPEHGEMVFGEGQSLIDGIIRQSGKVTGNPLQEDHMMFMWQLFEERNTQALEGIGDQWLVLETTAEWLSQYGDVNVVDGTLVGDVDWSLISDDDVKLMEDLGYIEPPPKPAYRPPVYGSYGSYGGGSSYEAPARGSSEYAPRRAGLKLTSWRI